MADKILIIDDDVDTLKLVGLMLQKQGWLTLLWIQNYMSNLLMVQQVHNLNQLAVSCLQDMHNCPNQPIFSFQEPPLF